MAIEGDSIEYELLIQWCEKLPFFKEPKSVTTCEIGVRKGLGSKLIINAIKKRIGSKPYEHIGIDPYNNLLYQHYDHTKKYQNDYTDEMRQTMVNDMADEKNFSFHHLLLRPCQLAKLLQLRFSLALGLMAQTPSFCLTLLPLL